MDERTIYYWAVDADRPVGGVRVLYRHVDILNAGGIPARIVHHQQGYRCRWFANETQVTYARSVRPKPGDIVVIPEVFGSRLTAILPGTPKVIFNQSGYLTFSQFPIDSVAQNPYAHPDVRAVMVVSDNVQSYIQYAFPSAQVVRVRPSVDTEMFRPGPTREPQISFMPRRNIEDARQVFNILRFRGDLNGFDIVPIHDVPQKRVARKLGDSAFFFSFGTQEGFGLPAAEAMASGCIVVGYHGFGGREFFRSDFSFPVQSCDVIAFAQTAAEALDGWRHRDDRTLGMGRRAADFIRENYAPHLEEDDVLRTWTTLLSQET